MIFQPWSNTELQAITAAAPLATRQNLRGQQGGRFWNVTPWWWDVLAEGDPNRPQALIPPWSFVEFELEEQLLEIVVQTATDLLSQPLTSMNQWRFAFQFLDEDVHANILPLLQQLASTDTIRTQPVQNWSQQSAAAVSTASSTTRAAAATGIKHVAVALSFGFSATTALAAITTVTVNLRDGATGAGPVLRSWQYTLPAAVVPAFSFGESDLNENGSTATAMTLEFAAAVTNLLTFVNLAGFDSA